MTLEFSLTPEQESIQRLVISRAFAGQRATIKLRG